MNISVSQSHGPMCSTRDDRKNMNSEIILNANILCIQKMRKEKQGSFTFGYAAYIGQKRNNTLIRELNENCL